MPLPNYKKILKNTTGTEIVNNQVGLAIPANSQIIVEPGRYYVLSEEIGIEGPGTLNQLIQNGDIIVNDGINDLSSDRGIDFLKFPDRAFHLRFDSVPERSNGFAAKTVQEAIEEARSAIEGKISVLPTFLNNGNTSNKWLSLDGSFGGSDVIPAVSTFNSKLSGVSYVNSNDNSSIDIEFYVNGTGVPDRVYVWQIRNKRYSYKTDLPSILISAGDTISCYAARVSGGGIITPSSVLVNLFVQSTDSLTGEGGGITLP